MERDHLIRLDFDCATAAMAAQPFTLAWDDGVAGLVDLATRTLASAVLRPSTKAVDAALLLARAMTPEPMRPGWPEALRMTRSVLPHASLLDVDARLAQAAAVPVITPETIVCDRGRAFLSDTFRRACHTLEISLQPAHPDTPTDKRHIERTLGSVASMFAQFLPATKAAAPSTAARSRSSRRCGPSTTSRPCWRSGSWPDGRPGHTTDCGIR